jgi:hypothetical protein
MPKQRAIFNPLEIDEHEGFVRFGQTMNDDANLIDISIDQLPDVIRALQSIEADHRANNARRAIQAMRDDLTGKKPASVRPINSDGPEAA